MKTSNPDGILAVYADGNRLALSFSVKDFSTKDIKRLETGDDADYQIAGRSAAGQLGIDVVRAPGTVVVSKDNLQIPISVEAHTPVARNILIDIGELAQDLKSGESLQWDDKDIKFGQLVNCDYLRRLEKQEVESAITKGFIAFDPINELLSKPDYTINDDGSVTLPISLLEFVFNEEMLRRPDQRFNILHHGRAGLIPLIDTLHHTETDILPDFMVGGIVFSPGPYHIRIREQIDSARNITQLPSTALFNGSRLMGMNPVYDPYSRNRQIELVNRGSQQAFGVTRATIDIFRSKKAEEIVRPALDWQRMSRERRMKTHRDGVSPLDVIKATDLTYRKSLLDTVSGSETGALVISSHGISKVPRGRTERFMAQNIREAARSFGRYRSIPEDLQPLAAFVKALKPAADRSRLVIVDELELRHIPNIVKSGDVRAILMRRYAGSGSAGVSMSKEDHSAIVNLVRGGVSIAWENNGDLRELHRSGLWTTPAAAERMEELDLVIAMYGSHFDSISNALKPQIEAFVQDLIKLVPVKHLGFVHGNMAGIMEIADDLARQFGLMSLGVGLELSALGQHETNLLCDGFLFLDSHERLYRQEKLDKFNTISIFNVGGFGTLEELAITVCTHKLLSSLPAPNILVDPDRLYVNAEDMISEISKRRSLNLGNHRIDLSKSPLGQPWVSNIVHRVTNYKEAAALIKRFWHDPKKYWLQAGIPPTDIAVAYSKHLEMMEQMGMRLAHNLVKAAEDYIA
ncbi:MAG TPA: hypothetical protein VNG32_02080 [Candidatus Dormibacteraeota bacterium]|nr:hypothetical protein [Candidatus Dormibacteraeota bacterium]